MSSFDEAVSNSFDSLLVQAGVDVVYCRGDDWVRLTAIPGQTTWNLTDENNVIVEYVSRDYLIKTDDLYLNGVAITPKRGDLIREQNGKRVGVYEVSRPDGSEQVSRPRDTGNSTVRIHTKLSDNVDSLTGVGST